MSAALLLACVVVSEGPAPTDVPPPAASSPAADPDSVPQQAEAAAPLELPGATLLSPTCLTDGTWTAFSAKPEEAADTWAVNVQEGEPVLRCTGQPYGYLRTKAAVADFDFGLQWRTVAAPEGNSGVLVYCTGEDRVWPTAMQVQLHRPECGSIFPTGDARSGGNVRSQAGLAAADDWNTLEISSEAGRLTVRINGVETGAVAGCEPASGTVALQSEGAAFEFRRVWLRPHATAANEAPTDEQTVEDAPQ